MRKAIFTCLLIVSINALADWVRIGGDENTTSYVNRETIQKLDDNMMKMLVLYDHKTPMHDHGNPYMSAKAQYQYNCKDQKNRLLAVSAYSGNMGSGAVIANTSSPGSWKAIAPRTNDKDLWIIACATTPERWAIYDNHDVSTSYIDMQSIRTIGEITSYQALLNFREGVSSSPMLSSIDYFEMKCRTREFRFLQGESFSEHFGAGKKIGKLTATMLGPDSMGFKPVSGVHEKHFAVVCKH